MSDFQDTVDTYNKAAERLALYFRGIEPRVKYINFAFELAGDPKNARVVEIGCGDGRDAKEIVKRAGWYQGFDVSSEMIKLAKAHVPGGQFEVANAATYEFPPDLDIIFAFASLLHLDKTEVKAVLANAARSLKPEGIFYISLKYGPEYLEWIKEDQFGRRRFYNYNSEIIAKLAGKDYEVAKTWRETHGHTEWVEIALRKKEK